MRAPLVSCLLLCAAEVSAATYVDEPALGHWAAVAGVHAGSTVQTEELRAFGGAGVRVGTGYQWDSGLGVYAESGFAARAGEGPTSAFTAQRASIQEWSFGLSLRWVVLSTDVAPFVEASVHGVWVRVRSPVPTDLGGTLLTGKLGVRVRLDGWEPYLALQGERLISGSAEETLCSTRLGLAIGVTFDL